MSPPQLLHDFVVAAALYKSNFVVGELLRLPAHSGTEFYFSTSFRNTLFGLAIHAYLKKQPNSIHSSKRRNASFRSADSIYNNEEIKIYLLKYVSEPDCLTNTFLQ
jgi:hypothetical protein